MENHKNSAPRVTAQEAVGSVKMGFSRNETDSGDELAGVSPATALFVWCCGFLKMDAEQFSLRIHLRPQESPSDPILSEAVDKLYSKQHGTVTTATEKEWSSFHQTFELSQEGNQR